jgi:hypothetical protein
MNKSYRLSFAGAVLAAITTIGASTSIAAPASPLNPLTSVAGATEGRVEQIDYRWGRRCYRDCHVSRHGRLYCTWHCYRPRRWW